MNFIDFSLRDVSTRRTGLIRDSFTHTILVYQRSFYGEGVQPTPVTNSGFKCYVRNNERWSKTGDEEICRPSLLPAQKVVGGTCTVGRRLYGRAVCTPDNFMQCSKRAYVSICAYLRVSVYIYGHSFLCPLSLYSMSVYYLFYFFRVKLLLYYGMVT